MTPKAGYADPPGRRARPGRARERLERLVYGAAQRVQAHGARRTGIGVGIDVASAHIAQVLLVQGAQCFLVQREFLHESTS